MISVVIPTYNREKTIKRAVDSVLCQTYKEYEVVVVDDGSTDKTEEILSDYVSRGRIRYFKQQNSGVVKARNRGVAESRGELIAFLDSDDEWLPEKLSEQIKLITQHGDGILVFSNIEYYLDGKKTGELFYQKTKPFSGQVAKHLLHDNFIATSSVLVGRRIFEKAGGFNEKENFKVGEDFELWLRISDSAEFYFVETPLVRYHLHSKQATKNKLSVYLNMSRLFYYLFKNSKRFSQIKKTDILSAFFGRLLKH